MKDRNFLFGKKSMKNYQGHEILFILGSKLVNFSMKVSKILRCYRASPMSINGPIPLPVNQALAVSCDGVIITKSWKPLAGGVRFRKLD